MDNPRKRVRELGIAPGILPAGKWNAITDVRGVRVGHVTLIEGEDIRTGVTAILPHEGNLYQDKVPAGIAVGNGFGKLIGSTQVDELGEIETPIVLTNTLAAPTAALRSACGSGAFERWESSAAVYAPTAMKPAWPSENCPVKPASSYRQRSSGCTAGGVTLPATRATLGSRNSDTMERNQLVSGTASSSV